MHLTVEVIERRIIILFASIEFVAKLPQFIAEIVIYSFPVLEGWDSLVNRSFAVRVLTNIRNLINRLLLTLLIKLNYCVFLARLPRPRIVRTNWRSEHFAIKWFDLSLDDNVFLLNDWFNFFTWGRPNGLRCWQTLRPYMLLLILSLPSVHDITLFLCYIPWLVFVLLSGFRGQSFFRRLLKVVYGLSPV